MGLLKRCSGSNICHFTKIIHNACFSILAYNGLLTVEYYDQLRLSRNRRPRNVILLYNNKSIAISRPFLSPVGNFSSLLNNNDAKQSQKYISLFNVPIPETVRQNLDTLSGSIQQYLEQEETLKLRQLSRYSFLEGGKLIRPTIVLLMAGCCSSLAGQNQTSISESQRKIALVSEMIHTASLVHDDVIDESDQRRNRPTVGALAGNKAAILVGDYILAKATQLLTTIGDTDIIALLAQVIEDLVKGEFMQLGSRSSEDERFTHYMLKTFKKTASLFAFSCKAVAKLAGCDDWACEMAYEYGKNLGLAFQLIDDTLDFVEQNADVGKPTFVDLRLGIATAPVLFASRQHKQLNDLILRRFCEPGDVELAYDLIARSDGVMRSRQLAEQYCRNAADNLRLFPDSPYKKALTNVTSAQCSRNR